MTSRPDYDVVAVGNALVDVLAHEDEAFIERHGLVKGTATMVDAATADVVYAAMNPATEVSGGSAANTAVGIASLGGRSAYIGKVRDDQLGAVFAHDLRAAGVHFDTPPATSGPPTGRCLVVVTADAERTMCTYLGSADQIGPDDIDDDLVASAAVTYLEGYLWDQPAAKEALRRAMSAARSGGRMVALTMSDPFCVDRHRTEFLDLVRGPVDIVFANQHELCSLFETDDVDRAIAEVRGMCEIVAVTRSELGSVVVTQTDTYAVDVAPVDAVVDLTGAGDLYAAGFLYGLTHDHDLPTAGAIGSMAAAEVIGHVGARPAVSLSDLATPLK
ncbi:MAG TPA: adenosine kinase [Acidimicrobiia bacterium]|nr:adenosine kinase [Acidimicrobiia bacterium]